MILAFFVAMLLLRVDSLERKTERLENERECSWPE